MGGEGGAGHALLSAPSPPLELQNAQAGGLRPAGMRELRSPCPLAPAPPPVRKSLRIRRRRSLRAASDGRNRSPAARRSRRLVRNSACAAVSTPSALIRMPSERPSATIASTIEAGMLVALGERAGEGLVDLQLVEGELPQIAEARIAGAEIVHGDPDAERLQVGELAHHRIRVREEQPLGDLKLQPPRREARRVQRVAHRVGDAAVGELDRREVHRDRKLRSARRPRSRRRGG